MEQGWRKKTLQRVPRRGETFSFFILHSAFLSIWLLAALWSAMAHANTLTVNIVSKGGALKKVGLGSLVGMMTNKVWLWKKPHDGIPEARKCWSQPHTAGSRAGLQ
jgi:hypothetical protein